MTPSFSPSLSYSAPDYSRGGDVSQQWNINSGAWPFGGNSTSQTWKTSAIVLGVLGVMLLTHRISLGKRA